MRVIAGRSRGRVLRAPPGISTRPTSDRVREAIFDILGSLVDIDGVEVADLFAGSGAMGIEALSRGAKSAVFVDSDPLAIRAVRANLVSSGLEGASAKVLTADVLGWLSRLRREEARDGAGDPGTDRGPHAAQRRFDLALVDPPYSFSAWAELLDLLDTDVAVLESNREVEVPGRFNVARSRRYGGTLVTVVRAVADRPFVRGAS